MQFVARVTPYGHMRLERVAYRMGVPTIDDPVAGQVDCGCTGLVPVASTSWHSQSSRDQSPAKSIRRHQSVPTAREAGLPKPAA
jgi:tripartite-type tricarboxylate transporter receptor subunit TctC